MPKHGKTRKQKMLADLRRRATVIESGSKTYELKKEINIPESSITVEKPQPVSNQGIFTTNYSYLSGDLRKTILLTSSIAIAELVIHFFVRNI